VRPSLRVAGIDLAQDRAYLKFDDVGAFPADEYEKVEPPRKGPRSAVMAADLPGSRALMRDLKAFAERPAHERAS